MEADSLCVSNKALLRIKLKKMNEAQVREKKLLLNEVITFKRSNLFFKGKIMQFKQVNPESIWAKVMNVADVKDTEWISLNNWYEGQQVLFIPPVITEKAPIIPAYEADSFPDGYQNQNFLNDLPDWL